METPHQVRKTVFQSLDWYTMCLSRFQTYAATVALVQIPVSKKFNGIIHLLFIRPLHGILREPGFCQVF